MSVKGTSTELRAPGGELHLLTPPPEAHCNYKRSRKHVQTRTQMHTVLTVAGVLFIIYLSVRFADVGKYTSGTKANWLSLHHLWGC